MKRKKMFKWMLTALLVVPFLACDNEPVEGEFVSDECSVSAEIEELRARVGGNDFVVPIEEDSQFLTNNSATLVIHLNGFTHLAISGSNTTASGFLAMDVSSPTVGTFDLLTNNEFGIVGNDNDHELLEGQHYGHYNPNPGTENEDLYNPFVTYVPNGGFGELTISEFNQTEQFVSGTFSFTGMRPEKDIFTGEFVTDSSGDVILQTLEIECGSFNRIPYTILDFNDGITSFTGEFFAKVDDVEFEEVFLETSRSIIGDVVMINVVARDAQNNLMRIDIPPDLDEGTYPFANISDGTDLIGFYNPIGSTENLTPNPGSITILELNSNTGELEATFEFTGTDPFGSDPTVVQVTDGYFRVDFLPSVEVLNTVIADIDGEPFASNYVESNQTIINGVDRYSFQAGDANLNKSLGFLLPVEMVPGTYEIETAIIDGDEFVVNYTPETGISSTFVGMPGTVTILEYDQETGYMEGTFEFIAIDILGQDETEYVVTSGEFVLQIL